MFLRVVAASVVLFFTGMGLSAQPSDPGARKPALSERYREAADQLIEAALQDSFAYNRLAELCDTFGPRFSGSANLEAAIDWIVAEMKRDGLENVRTEEVMVPRWVRGKESLELVEPRRHAMRMLGLGGSVGTPPEGITGEVVVVKSFEDLEARADEVNGRIVLLNAPFNGYGQTVIYRVQGAIAAARAGAVASLIRSVGSLAMQEPHTGVMRYDPNTPKIPHAAITEEDADMLQRMQDRGERIVVQLNMEAETLPDVPSRNVVAEIVGSEKPEEVVVIGGHIDSWDVGQGAMDDGGGSVISWEAVRLMHRLGLRPRRTVRVVLWTNEENGTRGAQVYRANQDTALANHVLAIESDSGVFKPQGFGFTGSDSAFAYTQDIGRLLERIDAGTVLRGGGGADIAPLMREGVPGMALRVDGTRYFWYHHTAADTMDKLDPHEVALCTATMAVMAYVVADMEERLPR